MGARSGSNYLSALKRLRADVWLGGERVAEVTSHPATRECARQLASLYDMQMERVEQMTYRTDDGGRSGLSFIQPKSIEELRKRSRMMAAWTNFSGGTMLQTPDLVNVAIAAMASAREFFAASDPRYGDNIANYYLGARKHDWCATHTVISPDARSQKTADGIIVDGAGAMAALAPFAEELVVFPSVKERGAIALAFAIPCNTKGLKFLCRERFDAGRSAFDAPLSSRFDVMDCAVIFENVVVPWSRVFLCDDLARCEALLDETGARAHMVHQAAIHNLAKAEFLLGLAACIAEVDGKERLKIQDRLVTWSSVVATMRTNLAVAENDATSNRSGIVTPALAPLNAVRDFPDRIHREMTEILGVPDLIGNPREPQHAALRRLAYDAAASNFANRHTTFDSAPHEELPSIAPSAIDSVELAPLMQRVKDFLRTIDR